MFPKGCNRGSDSYVEIDRQFSLSGKTRVKLGTLGQGYKGVVFVDTLS